MSRSYRQTPMGGNTTAPSEKRDKQQANRRYRRRVRLVPPEEGALVPLKREVSCIWWFRKDGKTYWGQRVAAALRAKLVRK